MNWTAKYWTQIRVGTAELLLGDLWPRSTSTLRSMRSAQSRSRLDREFDAEARFGFRLNVACAPGLFVAARLASPSNHASKFCSLRSVQHAIAIQFQCGIQPARRASLKPALHRLRLHIDRVGDRFD